MKNIISKIGLSILLGASLASCSKFDEINVDPLKVNESQVQIEYLFNNALIGAQQDPHIAERVFVLYWKTASRQQLANGLSTGSANDGWSVDYWGRGYASQWLNNINKAIQIGESRIADNSAKEHINNIVQISRIWRVYLLSELTDNFGPMPIDGFKEINPEYSSVKDVYYFMLNELKDATSKINTSIAIPNDLKKFDNAYGFDYEQWTRYANSMRLRLAMRLSEVDPSKAQSEFESAVSTNLLLTDAADNFAIQEKGGWDPLSGVMSREWNGQVLSATLNNLYQGLGGVRSQDQLTSSFHSAIKAENYIGKRFLDHYSTLTNDPSAGYFFDGLPYSIDPRAYKTFYIPGDVTNPIWSNYPSWTDDAKTTTATFTRTGGDITIDTKNTWSTFAIGDFGAKGSANGIRNIQIGKIPGLAQNFRNSENKRIFFASWETYFLLAEGAVRGWNAGITAQTAYEDGIKASFAYWGVSTHASAYLASETYNRVGTSVKFTHTTEPGASRTMNYVDGYTGATGTVSIAYPVNTIYKNGTVRNDALTKIITQKYIANMPWLPLESWNDHRRLGLPFFENPAVENPIPNLPNLNSGNYTTNSIKNFPQRLPYPSSFREADPEGYQQAVSLLGGEDAVLTPLWWAKQN